MSIAHFTKTTALPFSPHQVWAWHIRPGAFERLAPPWQEARIIDPGEGVAEGSRTLLRLAKGGIGIEWLAEHRNVDPPNGFDDVQRRGPFRSWEHRHRFRSHPAGCLLSDEIRYALPLGPLGRLLGGRAVGSDLARVFAYRHRQTASDLEFHRRYSSTRPLRIAISGASGLVGSALTAMLTTGGHAVVRLVRREAPAPDEAQWDPGIGVVDLDKLENLDALVHLAGEGIADGRWTQRRMELIRSSRVEGTRALLTSLERLERPPATVVTASAVGVYGDRGDETLDEDATQGSGFLADVGRDWEAAATAGDFAARRVFTRFGIVLSPRGGALAKMLPAFRMAAGGRLGSGHQYMSWVSIDDAISAVAAAVLDQSLSGPINVTAPRPVTNREFTATLGRVLGRPAVLPVPTPAARLAFGQMADEALLASAKVVPRRLTASAFEFRHPTLEPALRHLLGRPAAASDES